MQKVGRVIAVLASVFVVTIVWANVSTRRTLTKWNTRPVR